MYGGKKVKRRMLVTIVSAAMASSLLAGCGSGQTAGEDATAADESADTGGEEVSGAYSSSEEVTLNVYNWHTERAEVYESIFSRFHEKYPNITVNYIAYDDDQYYSMLSTSIQSGEAPDLFATSGTKKIVFQNYVDMGACMPLDDFAGETRQARVVRLLLRGRGPALHFLEHVLTPRAQEWISLQAKYFI